MLAKGLTSTIELLPNMDYILELGEFAYLLEDEMLKELLNCIFGVG